MGSHEGDVLIFKCLGESKAFRAVADKHISHSKRMPDIEHWDAFGEERCVMKHRLHLVLD